MTIYYVYQVYHFWFLTSEYINDLYLLHLVISKFLWHVLHMNDWSYSTQFLYINGATPHRNIGPLLLRRNSHWQNQSLLVTFKILRIRVDVWFSVKFVSSVPILWNPHLKYSVPWFYFILFWIRILKMYLDN